MFCTTRTKHADEEDHERLLEAQTGDDLPGSAEKDEALLSAAQLRELRQARHRRQGPIFALVLPAVALCLFAFGLLAVWHLPREQEAAAAVEQHAALPPRPAAFAGVVPIAQLVNETGFQIPPAASRAWDVHAAPTTRRFDWELTLETSTPGGRDKPMLLANRMSPGPLIEANLGDRLLITVHNLMPNATAIHWHGQPQNGTNFMDGTAGITQCPIQPGSSFTYDFVVQTTGTYWWHAHFGAQYQDGLYGAMVLHSPAEALQLAPSSQPRAANDTTYDEDRVVLLADLWNDLSGAYLEGYQSFDGPPGGVQGDEPVPDCALINGIGRCTGGQERQARMRVEAGKRYRLRVIHAGSLATMRFAIDGHSLLVVEADGTEVEPRRVRSLQLEAGQRYSVLVDMDQAPGAYAMHGDMTDSMFGYKREGLVQQQSLSMEYAGAEKVAQAGAPVQLDDLKPETLVPVHRIDPPAATKQETLLVSFGLDATSHYYGFMNGTAWEMPNGTDALVLVTDAAKTGRTYKALDNSQLILTNDEVVTMDLIINNEDDGDHPFHIHGYTPWVLGSGEGFYQYGKSLDLAQRFENPMRRDVWVVPGFGWSVIRVTLDMPGLWTLHCHIGAHMSVGLLAELSVLPKRVGPIPDAVQALCRA